MKLSKKDMQTYLESKGWHTWYNPEYWVHTKTIVDPKRQDYTNYGMSLERAYAYEINNEKPFNGAFLGLRW